MRKSIAMRWDGSRCAFPPRARWTTGAQAARAPPSDATRKKQDAGGDIFRSRVTPAVDPANYAAPSVEAILESSAGK